MESEALENLVVGTQGKSMNMDQEIDIYTAGTIALYTPPARIFDLPNIGTTIHIHGTGDGNSLYGGDIRPIGCTEPFLRINSYECAMIDYYLTQGGFNPIMPK